MSDKRDKAKPPVDLQFLRGLSEWMHEADIHEVSIEGADGCGVHVVRRNEGSPAVMPIPAASISTAPAPIAPGSMAEPVTPAPSGHMEKAPMVGVAYLAPSPNDPPFIEVGQSVRVGDPLLIIEAMKVMNQIQSTKAGTVKEILVENGQALEFDQPLVRID